MYGDTNIEPLSEKSSIHQRLKYIMELIEFIHSFSFSYLVFQTSIRVDIELVIR